MFGLCCFVFVRLVCLFVCLVGWLVWFGLILAFVGLAWFVGLVCLFACLFVCLVVCVCVVACLLDCMFDFLLILFV